MKEIMNLGFKLLLIALVAAVSLGFVNEVTKGKIAEQRELASQRAREAVFSTADSFDEIALEDTELDSTEILEAYKAIEGDTTEGFVFKVASKGYGGTLEVIVGISTDTKITGVRVGNHNETPGLGAKADGEPFYSQYDQMDATGKIGVSKTSSSETEIQAISGATITSTAVTNAVNSAIEAFEELSN